MNSQTSFSSTTSNAKDASSALHILLAPDGYYTYLGIEKPVSSHSSLLTKDNQTKETKSDLDLSVIQKNYRKLSLRLHPDRPTGDEEAFRVLERAKHVLMTDKLRKQYDLLGLDLEDDDHSDESHQEDEDGVSNEEKKDGDGKPDGVLSHMASATVAAFLQLAVRTAMMAVTSLYITKWKYTTIPAILFMAYTSNKIRQAGKQAQATTGTSPITKYDVASPLLVAAGVFIMFYAKTDSYNDTQEFEWNKLFWFGEALVMTMFCLNTVIAKEGSSLRPSIGLGIAFYIIFSLIALYIRGKGWRYITVLSIELVCALVAVLVFPIMEMIMETIVDEKMRKIGDRVRMYSKVMEDNHKKQIEELERRLAEAGDKSASIPPSPSTPSSSAHVELD